MASSEAPQRGRKTVEAAAAILVEAGGSLPITTLNKALFYADLTALVARGTQLTETAYLALKAGPVVAKYDSRVVGALVRAGWAQQDEAEDGFGKPVSLIAAPSILLLDEGEMKVAKLLAGWAKKRSAKQLSDFSHDNLGWKIAWEEGLGAGLPAKPINMLIAMQQIADSDDWLETALTQEEQSVFESAHDDGASLEIW
jgi:uncharacterized phage-associated protein